MVNIDKFICALIKDRPNERHCYDFYLQKQGLRYDDEKDDIVPIQQDFKIEKGKYYMCIKDVYMDGNKANVDYIRGKVYKSEYDGFLTDEDGEKLHSWNDSNVSKFFRPATEEEVAVSFLTNLASEQKDVPPEIQQVINDHFDEMLDNEPIGVPVEKVKLATKQGTSELTEFEEILKTIVNSYAQPIGRKTKDVMTDRGAKSVAKTLLSIARKQLQPEFDKELELAYKNQDEVQFQRGYEAGYNFAHQQVVDNNVSQEDIEQLVDEYQFDGHPCDFQVKAYKQGIERVVEFIKEK